MKRFNNDEHFGMDHWDVFLFQSEIHCFLFKKKSLKSQNQNKMFPFLLKWNILINPKWILSFGGRGFVSQEFLTFLCVHSEKKKMWNCEFSNKAESVVPTWLYCGGHKLSSCTPVCQSPNVGCKVWHNPEMSGTQKLLRKKEGDFSKAQRAIRAQAISFWKSMGVDNVALW